MDLTTIHEKWQREWAQAKLGEAQVDTSKPKFFMIFAYPGISGFLHVGHMRGYSYTDMFCRYKRMRGYNVLFPVGTHASGNLPYAFVKKLKNNDQDWIAYLKRNGATDADIKNMDTAEKVVDFFNKDFIENSWKTFGFLFDERRFTSTIYPDYKKFIEWQFKKLNEAGLLIQKPYFATFCPEDGPVAVDASETDISKGGSAEKNEYTALKFKFGDAYLIAATLRPETVFGQTNLWANPDATYVKADVAGETWILSAQAAEKLAYQKDDVMVVGEMSGRELLGKTCIAPIINKEIPILPATFCNPDVGTGLVTCVPSDAPYDYVALRDLQTKPELMRQYDLDPALAQRIELIPIIETKGYGPLPAKEIVDKLGISSQEDKEKLEEATKEIYKTGFHSGRMRSNAGEYAGKSVAEAKELMRAALLGNNEADIFHDLSEEVICRCGERVYIKRVDDQWFIDYSNQELTEKSKEHAAHMHIYPDDFKRNFTSTLDWFGPRACARLGSWVGTQLPFDTKWTIEPIADSTLYPLYYLVSMYVNDGRLSVDDLTEEFFDYVYLGRGLPKNELWETIRAETTYWYPLDINLAGMEHRSVHFPVFVMNHVGLLPEHMWPQGMIANAWVTAKAKSKISKSKGGAEPVPGAIAKYGVDSMRLFYAHIGSPDTKIEWDESVLIHYKHTLERVYTQCEQLLAQGTNEKKHIDDWLASMQHQMIANVTSVMDAHSLRDACTILYFNAVETLKWYTRRGGNNKETLEGFIKSWAKLMSPITPHLAEEIWAHVHGQGLVAAAHWPLPDASAIHPGHAAGETLIQGAIEDMRQVIKLAKVEKPSEIVLFVTADWKAEVYNDIKKAMSKTRNMGEILREVLSEDRKDYGKEISKIVQMVLKDPSKMPVYVLPHDEEFKILEDARDLFEQEFNCAVKLVKAEESTEAKALAAAPGKPAILVK